MLGSCEHGNEHLGSTKREENLNMLKGYYLLTKLSAPWN